MFYEGYIMRVFRGGYQLIFAKMCFCREKVFLTCEVHLFFCCEFSKNRRKI